MSGSWTSVSDLVNLGKWLNAWYRDLTAENGTMLLGFQALLLGHAQIRVTMKNTVICKKDIDVHPGMPLSTTLAPPRRGFLFQSRHNHDP